MESPFKKPQLIITPEIEYYSLSLREIDSLVAQDNADNFDLGQAQKELEYTQRLADSRIPFFNELESVINWHIGSLVAQNQVLEIGPGAEDFLYRILSAKNPLGWKSLEINRNVVDELNINHYKNEGRYSAIEGTMRNIPFRNGTFDTVCGTCVLDSVVDFDNTANELYRVLKYGGNLFHIQDLMPSHATVFNLLSFDCRRRGIKNVGFYTYEHEGSKAITHIKFDGEEAVSVVGYMHSIISQIFQMHGFKEKELAYVMYTSYDPSRPRISCIVNSIIRGNPELNDPNYSSLVMVK